MADVSRESLAKRQFIDRKNYPYGFSRSGDFSINESKALTQHGSLIAALVDGLLTPENQFEQDLLSAAHGQKTPTTSAEKAWVKYQTRINRPKTGSIYGAKTASTDDEDEDTDISDDTDLEIELDDEG